MQPRHYSIPKPCSEDWNSMKSTEQGAFCAKCTKEVLDCSTLKTGKIKTLVDAKKDPCVRIYQSQLDEMNFIEWFNSLSLLKQVKYLFLFAFLFVTNQGGLAQNGHDSMIQPQTVTIDSVDNITYNELSEDYEIDSEIPELITYPTEIIIPNPHCQILSSGAIVFEEPFIFGDFAGTEFIHNAEVDSSYPIDFTKEDDIAAVQTNYITVEKNNYTFLIAGDQLIFHANARQEAIIHITIKKSDSKEVVFFDPILVSEGQKEVYLPLTDFENGRYTIILKGTVEKKAIELMYW